VAFGGALALSTPAVGPATLSDLYVT